MVETFSFINSTLYLSSAALYTAFDLKMLFIGSILMFEVGSVVCGAAPNMNALIIGRTLAGIGGAGVYMGYELRPFWTRLHANLLS